MGGIETLKNFTSYENKSFVYSIEGLIAVNVVVEGIAGNDDTEIKAGTLMGMITASKTYNIYDNAAGDGRTTAIGILLNDIGAISEGDKVNATILVKGSFVKELLTGYDANALTDLLGRLIVVDANKTILAI